MRGDLVIARACGQKPIICRVWHESERGVWLTDETGFELLSSEQGGVEPILGFPREDVFKYDPELASSVDILYETGKWRWNKLSPY